METKKYEYIDSLRGIAILLVIFVHIGTVLEYTMQYFPFGLRSIIHSGQHGVQLFFIVSAYTLTMSYYSRLGESNSRLKFFIRRFFRISPMIYCILIYYIFYNIDWDLSRWKEISLTGILTTITFSQTLFSDTYKYFAGGWTVSVEFLFYCMLPFLCVKIKNLNSSIIFFLLTLILAVIYDTFLKGVDFKFILFRDHYTIFYQLPVFALGILSYWIINDKNREIKSPTLLFLFFTALLFCYITIPYHVVFGLVFVVLVVMLQQRQYKFLSNKILAKIGLVSFSMYILHFPVIHFLNYINFTRMIPVNNFYTSCLHFVLMFIVVTAITFPLAYITYKYIEVPGQNLGRKLIKKIDVKHQHS